ncbi:Cellulose-growth-specific protein, partial [Lachnellula suecica]
MRFYLGILIPSSASVFIAHGGAWRYEINGVIYEGYHWWENTTDQTTIQRRWPGYDPVVDPYSTSMACNNDATATPSSFHAPIAAGSTITAHYSKNFTVPYGLDPASNWNLWPHDAGPALVYMAACNGPCDTFNPSGAVWFKIFEAGLLSPPVCPFLRGVWITTGISKGEPLSVHILESLRPGQYLIRHELIALHVQDEKQFYPECAQLNVTGSGKDFPGDEYLVAFPGAYNTST